MYMGAPLKRQVFLLQIGQFDQDWGIGDWAIIGFHLSGGTIPPGNDLLFKVDFELDDETEDWEYCHDLLCIDPLAIYDMNADYQDI